MAQRVTCHSKLDAQNDLKIIIALASLGTAFSHAILTNPTPRANTQTGNGVKLTPFTDARKVVNAEDGGDGCGGLSNNDAGAGAVANVYTVGETIEVGWTIKIAHSLDDTDTGVRVAIKYSDQDSFPENILAGGVAGDPTYDPVSAGSGGSQTEITLPVTLPVKTCNACVLQWVWAARQDGGFYLGCSDIRIVSATTSGQTSTTISSLDASTTDMSSVIDSTSSHSTTVSEMGVTSVTTAISQTGTTSNNSAGAMGTVSHSTTVSAIGVTSTAISETGTTSPLSNSTSAADVGMVNGSEVSHSFSVVLISCLMGLATELL